MVTLQRFALSNSRDHTKFYNEVPNPLACNLNMNSLSCSFPNKTKSMRIKMETMDATLPSQSQYTICRALVCNL